jgi:chorismate synthase
MVTRPRPGHADLAGALKYNHKDVRNILERSSARETTVRVAVGAVCKKILKELGIEVVSWVVEIGGARYELMDEDRQKKWKDMFAKAEHSEVRCPDKDVEKMMKSKIDEAKNNRDTVGGVFEIVVVNVPPGLGSHVHWDKKLNARLAGALMSIQAIKGVEIGIGFEVAREFGSKVHDEILYKRSANNTQNQELQCDYSSVRDIFYRKTNNAGGIEGGMSNGEPIVLRAAMKPIPTLMRALQSVDIKTKKPFEAAKERSDICAVPAASVVGEGVVAFEMARAVLEKFGGDSMDELKRNYLGYLDYLRRW